MKKVIKVLNLYERIMWFMFGMIQVHLFDLFDWWAFLTLPVFFVVSYYVRRLWDWKPNQRTVKDYE